MSAINLIKLGRVAGRALPRRNGTGIRLTRSISFARSLPIASITTRAVQPFSTTSRAAKPLTTEILQNAKEAPLTDNQYHELADDYLDTVLEKAEARAEAVIGLDVEYSAGVMTIEVPNVGKWVINKQPPNKQIWLSSPRSGPKRFNWVVISEDQSSKQDTATGGWIYLKDGAYLNEILDAELGLDMEGVSD
ncbi:frataxin [Pseudomassariella vexata]|uniref:ferroxidase n=1 Tax=Pseudomassariella vexata TaxID=1141098 RepID=A0A1Y2DCG6_9PEZI|nr:frataxin [Pseudomassariella vexata]ORY56960.1 frataxin [Pseudomassariella vexata]